MIWPDLSKDLTDIAPSISKLLNSDNDNIVEGISIILLTSINLDTDKAPEDFKYQLQNNKKLVHSKLKELNKIFESSCNQDILKNEDVFIRRFPYCFSLITTMATLIYVFVVTIFPIPKENLRVVDTSLGFMLGSVLSTIIGYFFGSSFANKNHNKLSDK